MYIHLLAADQGNIDILFQHERRPQLQSVDMKTGGDDYWSSSFPFRRAGAYGDSKPGGEWLVDHSPVSHLLHRRQETVHVSGRVVAQRVVRLLGRQHDMDGKRLREPSFQSPPPTATAPGPSFASA